MFLTTPKFRQLATPRVALSFQLEFYLPAHVRPDISYRQSRRNLYPMRRIKTALIGTGFMGKTHAEGIRRLGNVDIFGVASITEQMARDFADANGIPHATGDYRQ